MGDDIRNDIGVPRSHDEVEIGHLAEMIDVVVVETAVRCLSNFTP